MFVGSCCVLASMICGAAQLGYVGELPAVVCKTGHIRCAIGGCVGHGGCCYIISIWIGVRYRLLSVSSVGCAAEFAS